MRGWVLWFFFWKVIKQLRPLIFVKEKKFSEKLLRMNTDHFLILYDFCLKIFFIIFIFRALQFSNRYFNFRESDSKILLKLFENTRDTIRCLTRLLLSVISFLLRNVHVKDEPQTEGSPFNPSQLLISLFYASVYYF